MKDTQQLSQWCTNLTYPDKPPANVIFLFGAGASVDADIPDTYKFVTDFEEHVKQQYPKLFDLLSTILKAREEFNEKKFKMYMLIESLDPRVSKMEQAENLMKIFEDA